MNKQIPANLRKPCVQWAATDLRGQMVLNRCLEDSNSWVSRLNIRDGISGAEQEQIAKSSEALA
jgi:hypothetical protein